MTALRKHDTYSPSLSSALHRGIITDVDQALHILADDTVIAVDFETTGVHIRKDRIMVVSLFGEQSFTPCVLHVRGDVMALAPLFGRSDVTFIYHNGANFDIPLQMAHGLPAPALAYDTLVGENIVGTGRKDAKVNLKDTLQRRLGVRITKNIDHGSWSKPDDLTRDQLIYCIEDIIHMCALYRAQQQLASDTGQLAALELEMDIVPLMAHMVYNGLPINLDTLREYRNKCEEAAVDAGVELMLAIGSINMGSWQQVKSGYANVGIRLDSTGAPYLNDLLLSTNDQLYEQGVITSPDYGDEAKRLIQLKLDFAENRKILSMFSDQWILNNVYDGRVYPRYRQCGCQTGRMSSDGPNIQQTPRILRSEAVPVFRGADDWVFVSVDYVQIELVIAAWIAQDHYMLSLFERGDDVHKTLGGYFYGKKPEDIVKKERQVAKSANFGLLYGAGAEGLRRYAASNKVFMTYEDAVRIRGVFFDIFPGIRKWHRQAYNLVRDGYKKSTVITMPNGFRRVLAGIDFKPSSILNTQVQGSAAVGIKQALRQMRQWEMDEYLVSAVHDEIVAYCPANIAEQYAEAMQLCMVDGMSSIVQCPVRTETTISPYWSKG